MTITYDWKSSEALILRKLRTSQSSKIRAEWNRKVSAGFVAADLQRIGLNHDGSLTLFFTDGSSRKSHIRHLNLRETEEAVKCAERQAGVTGGINYA